jgi:hypothetical protein
VRFGSRAVDADTFRYELGLASTWFDVGELTLTAARPRVVYGGKVEIAMRASGVGRATLQRRIGAGRWKTLATVNGRRTVSVEPRAHTLYRLSDGSIGGPVVPVAVIPKMHVTPVAAAELAGDVRPVVRGSVTVLRRVGVAWKVVAHPHVDPNGHFSAPLRLRPGSYRVSVTGDARYADASARLTVTPRLLASLAR